MFKGIKSLFVGILAGVGLGILFSPKKGTEIRKNLKDEVDKGGTGFSTIKDTFVKMGKDLGSSCKKCYEDINENKDFQEGKKKTTKLIADTYNKNVPSKTRKEISKTLSKAKVATKKAAETAKNLINELKKP